MIIYRQASTKDELNQILRLQQENLPENLSTSERVAEGFVTVKHTLNILKVMNESCPHTIAVDNQRIVGYALSMHPRFGGAIEVLKPMFKKIEKLGLEEDDYIVMGQICIAKSHRKQGIFRGLYQNMKQFINPTFKKIITQVDARNSRSLNAHYAIGFEILKKYVFGGRELFLIVLK